MPAPAFANIQQRAEEAALRRLANARFVYNGVGFNCLHAFESHPLGLVGLMGETRHTARLPKNDVPDGLQRNDLLEYDPSTYTLAELAAMNPNQFHVELIEPYNTFGVRIWLR